MRSDKAKLHLTHENVRVVARIGDKSGAFLIARNITVTVKHFCRVEPLIEIRRSRRTLAVQRLKVGPSAVHVAQ